MKAIRDATTIIGMLERGDAAHALSEEIVKAIQHLRDVAGPKGKKETGLPVFEGAPEK